MKTIDAKQNQVNHQWHLIDLKGQILGRSSVQIAKLLMGKYKPTYTPNIDNGDYVVAINAADIAVTGKKLSDKVYTSFSGYPGGLKRQTLAEKLEKNPTSVITHAVKGMLPKNKLQSKRLARLKVFAGTDHPYQDKFK